MDHEKLWLSNDPADWEKQPLSFCSWLLECTSGPPETMLVPLFRVYWQERGCALTLVMLNKLRCPAWSNRIVCYQCRLCLKNFWWKMYSNGRWINTSKQILPAIPSFGLNRSSFNNPNFKEVGEAYCFSVVCLSIHPSIHLSCISCEQAILITIWARALTLCELTGAEE